MLCFRSKNVLCNSHIWSVALVRGEAPFSSPGLLSSLFLGAKVHTAFPTRPLLPWSQLITDCTF